MHIRTCKKRPDTLRWPRFTTINAFEDGYIFIDILELQSFPCLAVFTLDSSYTIIEHD